MRQLPLDGRCGRRGRGKERFVMRVEPQGSYVSTSGGYRRFVLVFELIFMLVGYRKAKVRMKNYDGIIHKYGIYRD
jgi:hypothetical protein